MTRSEVDGSHDRSCGSSVVLGVPLSIKDLKDMSPRKLSTSVLYAKYPFVKGFFLQSFTPQHSMSLLSKKFRAREKAHPIEKCWARRCLEESSKNKRSHICKWLMGILVDWANARNVVH